MVKLDEKLGKNSRLSEELAKRIRLLALRMTNLGNSSHIGSILSIADILAVLYGSVMDYRPDEPKWANRDRFILSKGHAGAGVYAVLAECGFFPPKMLDTHYQNGSNLSGHVSHKGIPGVEVSTGSLGHGLSIASGMAFAGLKRGAKHRYFVLLGDGECDEGATWEAALFAAHHRLNNLFAVVDRNNLQSILSTEETLQLEPFVKKWEAFGWRVLDVDGHSHSELLGAFSSPPVVGSSMPTVVIANTVKGKGVSFMENEVLWHYRSPQHEEYALAKKELDSQEIA